MAQVRPKILLRYGRINLPVRVPLVDLLVDAPKTTLTQNVVDESDSLPVKNTTGFEQTFPDIDQLFVLIGDPSNQATELIPETSITRDNIGLAAETNYPHSFGTVVRVVQYDQIELWWNAVLTDDPADDADLFATLDITPDKETTDYNDRDLKHDSGYYWARFKSSAGNAIDTIELDNGGTGYVEADVLTIDGGNGEATIQVDTVDGKGVILTFTLLTPGGAFETGVYAVTGGAGSGAEFNVTAVTDGIYSPFSDPAPWTGYTLLSARSSIDKALNEINKKTSTVLTDEFAFQQLDAFQEEVLQEQKRWSFMQSFNTVLGRTQVGTWRVALPTNIEDPFTNKGIWNFRIGKQPDMVFVDKAKWDELTAFVCFSTLAEAIEINDTTVTLTDSSDFDDGGYIQIGARTIAYTENDRDTGILTLSEAITDAEDEFPANTDVFQGASLGEPMYWTTFAGYAWHWPLIGQSFDNRSYYMDYYKKQTRIVRDSDELVVPDSTAAMYYLEWKFLVKLNNGDESEASKAKMELYLLRREKMKQKNSIGRTFRLKPLKNSLTETNIPGRDPAWIRDGNFPNI